MMRQAISPSDPAAACVRRAVLAPSSHNTQPWRFRSSPGGIDLLADRTRALPVNDPDDRELTISCGCALMNLRIAAADEGLDAQVRLLPDPAQPDLLARVTTTSTASGSLAPVAALMEFVERRRTCRRRFEPRVPAAAAFDELVEAASAEGAWLRALSSEEQRRKAADLVAQGDAAQWANPDWRRELAAWMHPRHRGDGLTVSALTAPVTRLVVRTFDMGGSVGAKDRRLAEASPVLAVLGTDGDDVRDWLLAGQALQRVLLVACRHGLQASYCNQPIQLAALRIRLQELVGSGFAQIMLRLGYPAEETPQTPRRAIDDVIEST